MEEPTEPTTQMVFVQMGSLLIPTGSRNQSISAKDFHFEYQYNR